MDFNNRWTILIVVGVVLFGVSGMIYGIRMDQEMQEMKLSSEEDISYEEFLEWRQEQKNKDKYGKKKENEEKDKYEVPKWPEESADYWTEWAEDNAEYWSEWAKENGEKWKEWGEVSDLLYLFHSQRKWSRDAVNRHVIQMWNYMGY